MISNHRIASPSMWGLVDLHVIPRDNDLAAPANLSNDHTLGNALDNGSPGYSRGVDIDKSYVSSGAGHIMSDRSCLLAIFMAHNSRCGGSTSVE